MLRTFHNSMHEHAMVDGELTNAFLVANGVNDSCVLVPIQSDLSNATVLEVSNLGITNVVDAFRRKAD